MYLSCESKTTEPVLNGTHDCANEVAKSLFLIMFLKIKFSYVFLREKKEWNVRRSKLKRGKEHVHTQTHTEKHVKSCEPKQRPSTRCSIVKCGVIKFRKEIKASNNNAS